MLYRHDTYGQVLLPPGKQVMWTFINNIKVQQGIFTLPPTKHCDNVNALEEYFLALVAGFNIKVS